MLRYRRSPVVVFICSITISFYLILLLSSAEKLHAARSVLMIEDESGANYLQAIWESSKALVVGDDGEFRQSDSNKYLPTVVSPRNYLVRDDILSVVPDKTLNPETIASFYMNWRFQTKVEYRMPYRLVKNFLARASNAAQKIDVLSALFSSKTGDIRDRKGSIISKGYYKDDNGKNNNSSSLATEFLLKTYDYDPRLTMAVYSDTITNRLKNGIPLPDIYVPFSWYDWADLSILNDFIDLPQNEKPNHTWVVNDYFSVEQLFHYEQKFGRRLFDQDRNRGLACYHFNKNSGSVLLNHVDNVAGNYCETSQNPLLPGFQCFSILPTARPEVYRLQARSKLYSDGPIPVSLVFLNRNGPAIQVQVNNSSPLHEDGTPRNLLFNGLLEEYFKRQIKQYPNIPDGDFTFDHLEPFVDMISNNTKKYSEEPLKSPEYRLELDPSDFEFNAVEKVRELEANYEKLNQHQRNYLASLRNSLHIHFADCEKFFREARDSTNYVHLGHHFDARFFHGIVEDTEMRARLDAIVRAWLSFTMNNNLTSWLSHGTLYGWLYNGLAFPWDRDHDMQMPITHLNKLAEFYNQSVVVEDPRFGNSRYFIDVTSSITSRVHGNDRNNIDARFIDVDSGLYIDITGLSVSSEAIDDDFNWLAEKFRREYNASTPFYSDPSFMPGITNLTPLQLLEKEMKEQGGNVSLDRYEFLTNLDEEINSSSGVYEDLTIEQRYSLNKNIQVYNCRNRHFNTFWELSPLRLTLFHGMPAYVPNMPVKILKSEYRVPKEYGALDFEGKEFIPELRLWLDSEEVNRATNFDGTSSNAQHCIPRTHLGKLSHLEFKEVLQNIASLPELEDILSVIWNTNKLTAIRQKEIELMYDDNLDGKKKADMLARFQNLFEFGVYKDVFQERMERNIWTHMLLHSEVPFHEILKSIMSRKEDLFHELFRWNSHFASREVNWNLNGTDESEDQSTSDINLNSFGKQFFIMGHLQYNGIFDADAIDKGQSLEEVYHTEDENKYKELYQSRVLNEEKQRMEQEEKLLKEEERKKKEEEAQKMKEEYNRQKEAQLQLKQKELESKEDDLRKKESDLRMKEEHEKIKQEELRKKEKELDVKEEQVKE
ncbi:Mnn14p Ecym_3157 [Eremothecium cymbalariae DBVPG|uniref:LicD/FKTN/FKRP nucleotidyltransferase domain-containing protein n=1 Tax=Eremothecium cymbalariae (strain CBS 270.75 / DBVPG 7215 / KCTC 17166 / NRRL Y-17582) TaxID=931890 RepID=G8JR91_ERECY|nr:Hypothetical protein Ecym_3157 [Eremothecium cymbalariae DBVPG\